MPNLRPNTPVCNALAIAAITVAFTVLGAVAAEAAPNDSGSKAHARNCGSACAAVAVRWFGLNLRRGDLDQLEEVSQCSLEDLARHLERAGLEVEIRSVTSAELKLWSGIAIVHLNPKDPNGNGHFVLFAGDGRPDHARLLDAMVPPGELARHRWESVERRWSGGALVISGKRNFNSAWGIGSAVAACGGIGFFTARRARRHRR